MPEITGCSTNWYFTWGSRATLTEHHPQVRLQERPSFSAAERASLQPVNQFRDDLDSIVEFFCRFDRCDYFYQC
jgi:hypothetical protein